MKNSILFLTVALSLTACSPRDPDVLSPEDRAKMKGGGKPGAAFDATGKARLPQKMELGIGLVAEGRVLQAQHILKLASKLATSNPAIEHQGCLRLTKTASSENGQQYQISYNDLCQTSSDAFEANLSGVADLKYTTDGQNQIKTLEYSTHPLSETDMDVVTIQAFKKNAKDTLFIKEASTLSMVQQADGMYLIKSNVQSVVQTGFKETLTNIQLSNSFDAVMKVDEVVSWHSEVRGEAQNVASTNPTPATFILILNSTAANAPSDYTFQMGKTIRKGNLLFTDKDVTVISKDERSKSENKSSASRKKSTAVETVLPWDFWF